GHRGRQRRWRPGGQSQLGAASRRDGDVASLRQRELLADRLKLALAQHLPQNNLHLQQGEAGTQAAPTTAAERDPGVRAGRLLEESLRSEAVGLLVDLRVVVD